jgi:hypothetical protein
MTACAVLLCWLCPESYARAADVVSTQQSQWHWYRHPKRAWGALQHQALHDVLLVGVLWVMAGYENEVAQHSARSCCV